MLPVVEYANFIYQVTSFSFINFTDYLPNAYNVPRILRNSWLESDLTPWVERKGSIVPSLREGDASSGPSVPFFLKPY